MKLLFLTSRFPYPLEKGDKLRAFELIKYLSAYHEIILFAVNDKGVSKDQLKQLQPYCTKIYSEIISPTQSFFAIAKNVFSTLPYSIAWFYKSAVKKRVEEIIDSEKPDHIFCHLIRMGEYVRNVNGITKTLDYMDAFSAGMNRMEQTASPIMKQFAKAEHKRLSNYERDIFDSFDEHIIISKQDADIIPHKSSKAIHVVPNGVDLNFYQPGQREKKYDLLFAGNMNYPPNIQSVIFIAEKIMPLLIKEVPQIKFVIAGANPAKEVQQLASENIIITGWVDDIREYFYESKIMLAPMLISIGLQNKILQAMAMKTPCIVSTLANNAIGGIHKRDLIVADTAQQYIEEIRNLLQSKELQQQLTRNAYKFVESNFDWKRIVHELNKLLK